MFWTILHAIDITLWVIIAASVAYVVFFALISLFYQKDNFASTHATVLQKYRQRRFLILYPAYNEDAVILNSIEKFLDQQYDTNKYQLVVISDHMTDETNQQLSSMPITLLTPVFEKSSKARAMQYAVRYIEERGERREEREERREMGRMRREERDGKNEERGFDNVVVLDADNVVEPDFLQKLNILCNAGYDAIQCHRCAKNTTGDVAALDGASEEINNTIFRKAHNRLGLSSALIGSGMCFNYQLFLKNVFQLSTAGEDREMEALLLRQGVFIKYAAEINVFDEKVSNKDNFQRQRMRWMTAQVQSLLRQLPQIPDAILHGNLDFIDKTIQQALIPRSILIVLITMMALLMTVLIPTWCAKWWWLLAALALALYIAIPSQLRSRSLFGKTIAIPGLVFRMLKNLLHIDRKNTEFLHTTHGE
jgi:cellulose synthase/poly-beta-1,6-N-acetylglucosamine synthase-like glycosyltransferase